MQHLSGNQFEQLPMFMSAHEITSKYQPLDADRETTSGEGSWDPWGGDIGSMPRSAMTAATPRSTHQNEPDIRVYNATHHTATRGGGPGWRTGGGGLYRAKPDYEPEGTTYETDTELWERKAEEASMWGGGGGHPSLYESVEQEGVKRPVHLSTQQLGQFGKQQIIGGHHRIAAAMETDPHRLMPVLHSPHILEAKAEGKAAARGEGGYTYH